MRTPRQIARTLGWPEGRQEDLVTAVCTVPGCGWTRSASDQEALVALAAEHRHPPKLRIYRAAPGSWYYDLDKGNGQGEGAWAPSHPAALALGLAALEAASMRRQP